MVSAGKDAGKTFQYHICARPAKDHLAVASYSAMNTLAHEKGVSSSGQIKLHANRKTATLTLNGSRAPRATSIINDTGID
jgi:hypothetical protein